MAQSLNKTGSKTSSRILIIYTGGTIGMAKDFKTGQLKPIDFRQIRDAVPEIQKFNYKIDVVSFDPVMDSANMQPEHWIGIAEMVGKHYSRYDGFVVLHGSDTLAYTASALSFMLENLSKPVVLTGSQLPVGEVRTDAKENLITAIEIAATKIDGKPAVPEVCVYFDYLLFRGNRVSKVNASKFEAFQSPNYPPLAEAGVYLKFNPHLILKPGKKKFTVNSRLDTAVGVVRVFPGMSRPWLSAVLGSGMKAIILETYGSGNAPVSDWFVDEIKMALSRGVIILNVTQCIGGMVEQGVYTTSARLQKAGVLGGFDLTTEAALSKLMFLMGNYKSASKIKELIIKNLRGEITN
jgi:L-asparaginase